MIGLESAAFGLTQSSLEMLPTTDFVMRCEDLWPLCW